MMQQADWDRLTEQLEQLGFSKPGMQEFLEGCAGMDVISYYQRTRYGDDLASWEVGIKKDDRTGLYHPDGYNAILLKTHPVPPGTFGAINTSELEQRMKAIDWIRYERPAPGETESRPEIRQIMDDISDLMGSRSPKARDVAQRLQLRYWLHTPMEQQLNIAKYIYRYEKRAGFKLNGSVEDISAKEAYNLLCGRGVLKFYQKEGEPNTFYSHWKQFVAGKLQTLPDYDLMNQLKSLPIRELKSDRQGPQILYGLISGDRVPVRLESNGITETALLQADPHNQSVRLFTAEMSELNPRAYLLNAGQQYLFNKKPMTNQVPRQPVKKKNKGRSL